MKIPFWNGSATNVTTTICPTEPSNDDKARAASAQSFILQPFWAELLWAINEQRDAAAVKLRNPGSTWDEDARNLEHWRAVDEIVNFVHMYPNQVIEGGRR